MKKIVSLLLVVMMLVSMIPANVFAATETAELSLASQTYRTSATDTQQVYANNSITLTYNKGTYANALRDNTGDNHVRMYIGTNFTVEFPMNITQIAFTCSGTSYLGNLATDITGATVTTSGTVITAVLDTPATSFTVANITKQTRISSLTVTYEVNDAICLHEETEVQGYVAPTCTTEGATGNTVCVACGEVVKESEVLPISHEGQGTYVEGYVAPTCIAEGATGVTYCSGCDEVLAESTTLPTTEHTYDGDTCTVCGATIAVVEEETYTFSDYDAGTQYAENEEHVLSDLVTMYTTQAHFTTQLRLYSSSTHDGYAIIQSKLPIKAITVNAGNNADTLVIYGSNDSGATWTEAARITTTSTYTDYSASLAATPYTWLKLDVAGTNQVRIASMTLQFVTTSADECTHELTQTIAGTAATCTAPGQEDTLSCECGENVQVGAEIPALGHSYDDDYCTRCAIINPEAAKQAEAIDGMAAAGDQVIFYHVSNKVVMGLANGDRMGAASVTKANDLIPYSATHTAVMTVEQVGDYYRFQMGGQYLTSGATGSSLCFAALPAEGETDYTLWEVTPAAGYTYGVNIRSVNASYNGTDYNQYIEYYNVHDRFYPFGFDGSKNAYAFQIQLGLVNHITLTENVDEIVYEGRLNLDLNGFTASSVVADELNVYDSTATTAAAGTGKLYTDCAVAVDNTVEGVRYIALQDWDGAYTFHALELKLDTVTLRTNKAGIYYKASMACDEVLAGQIECHGVAVSIVDMPTADFANEENTAATKIDGAPSGTFTSGSVTNIFTGRLSAEENAARGELKIYSNSYIKLYGDIVLMGGNEAAWSMQDVMTAVNAKYAEYEAAEQETIKAFYAAWADCMTAWGLTNLDAAIAPAVPEEGTETEGTV